MADRLTSRQREAIDILRACDGYDDGWGVVSSGETARIDGQPWINWRTAYALRDRGVVEVEILDFDAARLRLVDRPARKGQS